jgi:hypothetical protein
MAMRRLMRGLLRWFRGDGPGTFYYLDANEDETALPLPADAAAKLAAGTPYFLIAAADRPMWALPTPPVAIVEGYGTRYGVAYGND